MCGLVLLAQDRNYWLAYLPASALVGLGVSPLFTGLNSAGVAGMDPNGIATGTAVLNCIRQIGASLGVAAMVAVIATAPAALGSYQRLWFAVFLTGLFSAALAVLLEDGPVPALLTKR